MRLNFGKENCMESTIDSNRRRLLATGGTALVAAGAGVLSSASAQTPAPATPAAAQAKPLPAYVAWKDANAMIVHTPTTIETKRSAFGTGVVTPTDQLFIRNNLPAPDASIVADRDAWKVTFEGVKTPRTLTVADLKTLGLETLPTVLQCSGNGRGYFASKPSGTKWTVGAAGCVIWSGVPVKAVVESLGGVSGGMVYMTSTGGETLPAGIDPKSVIVERSVPIEAMQSALLAWELNGEPIPLAHGGPLRLIVPGYSGVNNIKYVKRLAFTTAQTDAAIQKTGYRMSPPGEKGDPSQPPVWEMGVKSWVNAPSDEQPVKAGWVQLHGVAMGGTQAARRVEVSIDGGKTWRDAAFIGPDLGRYAWRQFALPVRLAPGTYTIMSRATDSQGRVQPESSPENTGGYLNSGWQSHGVKVVVV
jgi:DMSO/TMAO reductase YedYZ molybdopterin-dependent catalytic subunit